MSDGLREALNKAYEAGMSRYNSGKINPPSEVEKLDQIEAEYRAAHPVEPGGCNCADGQDGYAHRIGCPEYIHVGVRPVEPLKARGIAEGGGITDELRLLRNFRAAFNDMAIGDPGQGTDASVPWADLVKVQDIDDELDALPAPLLGLQQVPTVLLDRREVGEAILDAGINSTHPALELFGQTAAEVLTDAVMELAQQVPSREEIAAAAHDAMPFHSHGWKEERRCGEGHRQLYYAQADAVLALFSKPAEALCGKPGPRGHGPCVFTPGHHDGFHNGGEWTSHGDRGGWTWNDQPAEEGRERAGLRRWPR